MLDTDPQETSLVRPNTPKTHYHRPLPAKRREDERGEGVISAAIAVLIMAFLGVGMWVAFSNILGTTTTKVNNEVNSCIGSSNGGSTPAGASGNGC